MNRAWKAGILTDEDCEFLKDEFWIYVHQEYPDCTAVYYVTNHLCAWLRGRETYPDLESYTLERIYVDLKLAFHQHFKPRTRIIM
jgi:hypothetical protein